MIPRRTLVDESGQSLVEFAITFGILMAVVFALIEFALAFYSYGMISESAREGTRYAIVHGANCQTVSGASCTASAAAVNAYVSALGYPNLGGGSMTVNTTFPDGNQNPGSRAAVSITYSFPITLPFVPSNVWTMGAASQMSILQ